jgi:hypothetical protein
MKEALKLALEALEADELDMVDDGSGNMVFRKEQAITAIKEALAQPEQEPVAWEQFYPDIGKPQIQREEYITKKQQEKIIYRRLII